jgi:uncharacterized protein (TIGR03067 family)
MRQSLYHFLGNGRQQFLKGVGVMSRFLLSATIVLGFAGAGFAQQDADKLQGTWEITALVDDGQVVSEELLKTRYAQNARFTVKGQSINFLAPGTLQTRTILFVLDDKASPKTIDLPGAEKTGGKGIYLLADDVLMMCLAEPEAKQRPTEFSAKKGSPYLLMTLKRVKTTDEPEATQPKEATPAPIKDDDMRKVLIGTWGHQDDDWIRMFTLNGDGTFSSTGSFKKKLGKLFHPDVRSSGTWKLQDGIVICTVTASTDRDLRNQVFSYRVRSISANDLVAVDQFGNLRREWRAR